MAAIVFNIAKGKVNEYVSRVIANDPANSALIVVVLATAEADATLEDYDTLAAILAGSNAEATNTNYARKVIDNNDPDIAVAVDDANDWATADFSNQTWTAVAAGDSWVKVLICYDSDTVGGTDANIIPLTAQDFAQTPDGSDITLTLSPSGFYRAKKAA